MQVPDQQLSFTQALEQLGVSRSNLSEEEKKSIEEIGYVIINNVIESEYLEELRTSFERLMIIEGFHQGRIMGEDNEKMADVILKQFNTGVYTDREGVRKITNLVNEGAIYDRIYTDPKVLAAVQQMLDQAFKLSFLEGQEVLPGDGDEWIHTEYARGSADEPYDAAGCIWLLDDISPKNGGVQFVSGSHVYSNEPDAALADAQDLHVPAGSVIVYNGHIWKKDRVNLSDRNRRYLQCHFVTRGREQQFNQLEYIRKATYDRISDAAKTILDV
jgi:ectoine hydroxylase-related dioxygenase (phytanoyl-CoA dioxygenase family)